MTGNIIALLIIVLLVWLWLDGARARELAIGIARMLCQKQGVQFLDETVFLKRMGVRWTAQGIRLRRMFSFDFSIEGVGRRTGYLILVGTQLEHTEMRIGIDIEINQANQPQEKPASSENEKVIPFRKPDDDKRH